MLPPELPLLAVCCRLIIRDRCRGKCYPRPDNHDREAAMAILLDHTIVPAHDNEASARFFARIFGLNYDGALSHFAPVRVNDDLVLDFDTRDSFDWQHYAFKVSDAEFDAIFARVKQEGLAYGSGPF